MEVGGPANPLQGMGVVQRIEERAEVWVQGVGGFLGRPGFLAQSLIAHH